MRALNEAAPHGVACSACIQHSCALQPTTAFVVSHHLELATNGVKDEGSWACLSCYMGHGVLRSRDYSTYMIISWWHARTEEYLYIDNSLKALVGVEGRSRSLDFRPTLQFLPSKHSLDIRLKCNMVRDYWALVQDDLIVLWQAASGKRLVEPVGVTLSADMSNN
jgi:hypothetical protein